MEGCEEEITKGGIHFKAYFGFNEEAGDVKNSINEIFPDTVVNIGIIENQDWNAAWRESMEPVCVAEGIWVSPTWLKPAMKEGDYWIKIEPKMAFGTGHHETTRLCAQALLSLDISHLASPKLLDIGTGSGILCFVGDHAGYAASVGIEIDPDCAGNLAENIRDNSAKGTISFLVGTVESIEGESLFDTIVMNMIRTRSEPLLEKCKSLLTPNGKLVWSGILIEEKNSVVENAVENGWALLDERMENEWWCGVLGKQ